MIYCILAYPVLVHLSVLFELPALSGLALVALYAGFTFRALATGRIRAWSGLLLAVIVSGVIVHLGAELYALYLPPIVLPAVLFVWWAASLRAGQVPFVTRMALAIRGPLSPEHAAYTRSVTVLWVAVFGLLTVITGICALWASPALWSLVTNVLINVFLGLVFVSEYLYRRWHLRHEPHPGFVTFLRQIAKASVRPGS